ncbi:cyclin-dependent kinase inhibitor 3-like [Primulina huaijiensis]|uniref:cyclin-dependent kinase inhibitor 3-like n=1 Tax=Primulina huaijiensis TaxID=1492673 RepID=UPI003CC77689
MGKYMKKSKIRCDVAVKDVSQSSLGVRTRAKTLTLQRLQSSSELLPPNPDPCYLELRSRRLEKPTLVRQNMQNSEKVSSPKDCLNFPEKEEFGSGSVPKEEEGVCRGFETGDLEIEASCGENNLESEARERSTRESTPCSLIRAADTIITPSSSTKSATLTPTNQRVGNTHVGNMPTDDELEGFFAQMEEAQHRHFIKKYNFDIVNDLPLPGRYIWEKLSP